MLLVVLWLCCDSARTYVVPVAPAESLHVSVSGTDASVVLLPGLFGSEFGFRRVVRALAAAGYGTIVIEPLGIGSSGRPERADYSLTAQATRVAAVLDTLGVDDAIVAAHSVGASIALRLAYRRPDLVRGVVLLEGGSAEAAATPGFRRAMRFAPWIKLFGGVRLIRRKIRQFLLAASADSSWVDDAVLDGYTAGATRDLDATLRAYLGMARAREPEALRPHLSQIRCSVVLLIGGTPHAGGPPVAEVTALAASLARFAIDTVPGAGHFIHEERPDAVVAGVRLVEAMVATR